MHIFHRRLEKVKLHNLQPDKLWTAGLTIFTDRTHDEFSQRLGWRPTPSTDRSMMREDYEKSSNIIDDAALANHETDWVTLHMATDVIDQGQCGSCWAMAAITLLQGRLEAQTGQRRTFSAQQLLDCVPNPHACGGKGGCDGATVELAMSYVEKKGLDQATDLPYTEATGTCSGSNALGDDSERSLLMRRGFLGNSHSAVRFEWKKLEVNSAKDLMRAVQDGPLAISVGADSWNDYVGGIFNGCDKDAVVNHAVALFGYGKTSRANYWKIRNSWGKHWGENGFIRLFRHKTSHEDEHYCGTDKHPEFGVECKPYPDKVTVCGMCGVLYDSVEVNFVGAHPSRL